MKKISIIAVTIITLLLLIACEKKDVHHLVRFDTLGGSEVSSLKVLEGELVDKPEDPTKEGYDFKYWTLDDKKYDFNLPVEGDIVLKALWDELKDPIKYYIIKFDTLGGSKVSNIEVREGNTLNEPDEPLKEGYEFIEWQIDGKKFNFDIIITNNMTLTAKWKKIESPIKYYIIEFDTLGGSEVANLEVSEGSTIKEPIKPTKKGYVFAGWYSDDSFKNKYDFSNPINKSIVLYAKFKDASDDLDVSDWFD